MAAQIAKELLQSGKVREAIAQLGAHLREAPNDTQQRIFLFELLCFAGQYERAAKQLAILAPASKEAGLGAALYNSALDCERTRASMFERRDFPEASGASPSGTLNGKPFQSIADLHPSIGPRLEIFAGGTYVWIPFTHIVSVAMEKPVKLRDTLWAPAAVEMSQAFQGSPFGEVLIPAIYPFSSLSEDEAVWLGRATEIVEDQSKHEFPIGQKTFLVDDEEVPLLEVRRLEFAQP